MRKPSVYLSDQFLLHIWPEYSLKLMNKRTRENYFSIVCMICDYTKTDFLELTHVQARSYFDSLLAHQPGKRRVALSTISSRLSALRSVSTYIVENKDRYNIDENYTNVFLYIDLPENSEYLDKEDIPTIKELDKLLIAASDNPMMYLIFALVIRCGFTAGEVCKMKVSQICEDAANRFSVVFHEKNRTRYVKIPDDVVPILMNYKKFIPNTSEYMFYNKRGYVLKVRNLETLVNKYVSKAGLSNYTIQDIRNAAICYMRASGADELSVADYVGVEARWMYRYDYVIQELDMQPVDLTKIRIIN